MSLISRMAAPAATHELAGLVAALLSRREPPGRHEHLRFPVNRPSGREVVATTTAPVTRRLVTGPTGIGTSAARITARSVVDRTSAGRGATLTSPRADGQAPTKPARPGTETGTSVPELHCPPALRDDPALGAEVNDRLVDWAELVGIYPGRLDQVRAADFGRLIMLAHPDTDDPDRLLAAAKCALAEWATDDYYCDDQIDDAVQLLGSRLMVADAVVAPANLPLHYAPQLEQATGDDPVLLALRSGVDHLAQYASGPQVARLRQELALLFTGYTAEASWRTAGRRPPVWEYLAGRQVNSFLPCITLVDAVGGYELPATEYADPRVRRAVTMASSAATLVNDLYSMAKEGHPSGLDFNLPALIAAEEKCSPKEALERSVRIHDELVITFEMEAAALSLTGSPALKRFLAGVWAWLGGNREWHAGSARYNA